MLGTEAFKQAQLELVELRYTMESQERVKVEGSALVLVVTAPSGQLYLFTAHYKPLLQSLGQRHSLDLGACLTAASCNLGSGSHFSSTKRVTGTEGLFQALSVPVSSPGLGPRLSGSLQISTYSS